MNPCRVIWGTRSSPPQVRLLSYVLCLEVCYHRSVVCFSVAYGQVHEELYVALPDQLLWRAEHSHSWANALQNDSLEPPAPPSSCAHLFEGSFAGDPVSHKATATRAGAHAGRGGVTLGLAMAVSVLLQGQSRASVIGLGGAVCSSTFVCLCVCTPTSRHMLIITQTRPSPE